MKMEVYPLVLPLALPSFAGFNQRNKTLSGDGVVVYAAASGKMPAFIPEMLMTMSHIILTFFSSALKH